MIPNHYFEVICCPKCKSDLVSNDNANVSCPCCKTTYPVIDDIPILLQGVEDEVSQAIKQFYDSEWKRTSDGVLRAKAKHEDLSALGQQYIKVNESRFLSVCDPTKGKRFFLDAASGAQPRVQFSSAYNYHICVDFSLDGLIESRKLLGDRAVCVCGSLLSMPLKESTCDGIIASHVLYHIDKDLQADAIRELYRVLRPEGKVLVFYENPHSLEELLVKVVKKIMARKQRGKKDGKNALYNHSHTISYMSNVLGKEFGNSRIRVEGLRMFSRRATQKAFCSKLFGALVLKLVVVVESVLRTSPRFFSYVAYIAEKR